jgi:hypothetical protein
MCPNFTQGKALIIHLVLIISMLKLFIFNCKSLIAPISADNRNNCFS